MVSFFIVIHHDNWRGTTVDHNLPHFGSVNFVSVMKTTILSLVGNSLTVGLKLLVANTQHTLYTSTIQAVLPCKCTQCTFFVGNKWSFHQDPLQLILALNHRWAHMAFTTPVIITMFDKLLGGECYHANVLPICRYLHTKYWP